MNEVTSTVWTRLDKIRDDYDNRITPLLRLERRHREIQDFLDRMRETKIQMSISSPYSAGRAELSLYLDQDMEAITAIQVYLERRRDTIIKQAEELLEQPE